MRAPSFQLVTWFVAVGALSLASFTAASCGVKSPTSGYLNPNDVPEGGLPLDGVLRCGLSQTLCNPQSGDQCCAGPTDPGTCVTDASCPPGAGLVGCNDETECIDGQVCCATFFGNDDAGYVTAECASSCPAPRRQLCRANAECQSDVCVVQSCANGEEYEMCGLSTSASFPCTATP